MANNELLRVWRQYYHRKPETDYQMIDRVIRCEDDIQHYKVATKGRSLNLVNYLIGKRWWRLLQRVITLRPDVFMDEVDKSIHHHLAVQFKAPLLILELLFPKAKQRRKKNTPSKMLTRSMMRHGMKLRPRK